jgi:hypothetical protein
MPWWGAAVLGVLGCSPRAGTAPAPPTSAVPRHVPAPSAVASTPAAPPPASVARFVRVIEDDCTLYPRVEDLGSRSLVISAARVSIVEPNQHFSDATDVSSGLPSGRGSGFLFTLNPIVLQVERQPHRASMFKPTESDYARFRLEGTRWIPLTQTFGAFPIALPVASGTIVVGWIHEAARRDRDLVPAGNATRAWFLSSAGVVSDFSRWPAVLTWQQRSTPNTLWAIAVRPGQPGQYLLRIPMDGKPELSSIPGGGRCRGVDRLTELARLDEVTDDAAKLRIWAAPECISKQAEGTYRFEHSRWIREGEVTPIVDAQPSEQRVAARGADFALTDGAVSVSHRDGARERHALSSVVPGSPDRTLDRLHVTAGGREVWATTRNGTRCAIHRYQWPPLSGGSAGLR